MFLRRLAIFGRMFSTAAMTATTIAAYIANQRLRGLSPRTIERRRWSLARYEEHLGDVGLDRVTVDHVETFLARFETASTRQSVRSDLRGYHLFMMRRGFLSTNPIDLVDAPRVPRRAPSPIAVDDVRKAIETAPPAVRLMVMLGAYAGLRVSEIAHLRGEDCDLDAGELMVRGGKGGKDAKVPIAAELRAELELWPAAGRLFEGADRHSISSHIKRHFRRVGIEARPHDLRHSFGTMAARRSGGNMLVVAALMRHESLATSSRYVGVDPVGAELVTGLYGP